MSRLPRRRTVTHGRANLAHHGTVIVTVTTPATESSEITTSLAARCKRGDGRMMSISSDER